ncbi:NmrA/HSCARG family protein [Methylobacterium aquaticum]|uniref:NmrA family protein n=1 Tax=Methylobacterium aquaticum TaxID=270351 RepID=A0A0J6SSI6_9HYPH|nr:NmrA/HSCARG family protein [Methylobacterium aquaticum]KMO38220.1 NmrA family protein [Methylobacterium aquaticum]
MPTTQPDTQPATDHRTSAGRTVLVLGATGQQGGAVAAALRANGWSVRALVRDPDGGKAKRLSSTGVDVIRGDLDDPASVQAAIVGVHGVFSVQPSSGQGPTYGVTDEQEIRWGKRIADVALAAGVQHLVYSSVNAVGRGPTGMGHFDSKFAIEEHIRGLDLRSTIVRPAAFMELLMLPGMGLDHGYFSFFLRPEQVAQVIAVQDIGAIVAAAFAAPDHFAGRTIEIAGDEVTGAQLGEALSRAAGRTITYLRFPDDVLAGNAFLGRLAALVDDGRLAGNADIDALRREFGRLTRFDEWLSGPGKPLLQHALQARSTSVSLR